MRHTKAVIALIYGLMSIFKHFPFYDLA